MNANLECCYAIAAETLCVLYDEWKAYVLDGKLVMRTTKSKIEQATEDFEYMFQSLWKVQDIGEKNTFDPNLSFDLFDNYIRGRKLAALKQFTGIISECLSRDLKNRVSTLKFISTVGETVCHYADNYRNSILVSTHERLVKEGYIEVPDGLQNMN